MDILRSLQSVSTGYAVFEQDQVLTHDQLNSVMEYLDDQTRLTRVNLVGVGIACGLRVSLRNGKVYLSKGVGVTTDGDLLYFGSEQSFDRFKLYDASQPRYAPFYVDETMIKVYELVHDGVTDDRTKALAQFTIEVGNVLENMVAVLFMESYEKDRDICTGTSCDNLGKDMRNNLRLLLVDKASAGRLKQTVDSPADAFGELSEVTADRPFVPASLESYDQLAKLYLTACGQIHEKLSVELAHLYPVCSGFLSDVFPSDPSQIWLGVLKTAREQFSANAFGVQYYYDFLKDLVENYNEFCGLLFGDRTWCCPSPESFPKHLLLGNLVPGTGLDDNRTPFFPSPVVSRTIQELNHARFLARKLDTMIQTFKLPPVPVAAAIRITPSLSEERPLEERAIPYYYQVNAGRPIQRDWSFRLTSRGMEARNYSYNSSLFDAKRAPADPLASQIGRFSFFRIEGHLGQSLSKALAVLEGEVKGKNLPFAVRSVMLGADKGRLVRPPPKYTDIHRLHYVLRQDIYHQLDDVMQFSAKLRQQVYDAVDTKAITDSPDDYDGPPVKGFVDEKNNAVSQKAGAARTKLNRTYSAYKQDASWATDVSEVMKSAGEFKYNLGKVAKTEFNTPFDSLISSAHLRWLDWLDEIIRKRDDAQDDELLLSKFASTHPALEHSGGVTRGGTFVLVYDHENRVVADFELPYICCETVETEDETLPLPKPPVKPGWVIDHGINIFPSRDRFIKDHLRDFKIENDLLWDGKLIAQKESYFKVFEDTFSLIGNAWSKSAPVTGTNVTPAAAGTNYATYADRELAVMVDAVKENTLVVDYLRKAADQPEISPEAEKVYAEQIKVAEAALAKSVTDTVQHIDSAGADVSVGSEGMAAMIVVDKALSSVQDVAVMGAVNATFDAVKGTTALPGFRVVLGGMSRG